MSIINSVGGGGSANSNSIVVSDAIANLVEGDSGTLQEFIEAIDHRLDNLQQWQLIGAGATLESGGKYIIFESGTFTMPSASQGDLVDIISSPQNPGDEIKITLPDGGFLFSAPGQLSYPILVPNYSQVNFFNVGGNNWSLIKNFESRVNFPDQTVNGVLGDNGNLLAGIWLINQTTSNIDLTLPSGLSSLSTFDLTIINIGTVATEIEGIVLSPNSARRFVFAGSQWLALF